MSSKEPIKAGDMCYIVEGYNDQDDISTRRKDLDGGAPLTSPNIGKIVKVLKLAGEHEDLGTIWLCEGDDIAIIGKPSTEGVKRLVLPPGQAHLPQCWLKKIEAPKQALPAKVEELDTIN